jgi:hypothetical protein
MFGLMDVDENTLCTFSEECASCAKMSHKIPRSNVMIMLEA